MTQSHLGFPLETVLVFAVLSIAAILIDLYAHRSDKAISLKSASFWSIFWIFISLLFGVYLWKRHGIETANLFFTGYALEKVLSVDNLFLIMAIFSWFKVPENLRHRVLYWGIIGAIIFRLIFVLIGTSLLALSSYVEILFAVIVAWTAYMMLKKEEDDKPEEDYSQHLAYKLVYKYFPVFPRLLGNRFFIKKSELPEIKKQYPNLDFSSLESASDAKNKGKFNKFIATPLFLCLAIIELSDVMFAFDSVPAVIAVSKEPLIVYSAMMFAILGLRTMYFVLEALKNYLVYLEKAVVILLFFVAFKLALSATNHIFHHGFDIMPSASLIVVLTVLTFGIVASIIFPKKK